MADSTNGDLLALVTKIDALGIQVNSVSDTMGAQLKATTDRLVDKIDFNDRSAQQLVRLVETRLERVQGDVDELKAQQKDDRKEVHTRIDDVERTVDEGFVSINARIGSLEISRAKFIGMLLGSGGLAGTIVAIVQEVLSP